MMQEKGKERLLIVDDESNIRDILSHVVSVAGYSYDTAKDAEEAIEKLEKESYHLVLTDIRMPGLDGIGLLKYIVEKYEDVVVVVASGVDDVNTAMEALHFGADDYVLKPLNFDIVMLSIDRALEKRRLIIENREYQRNLEEKIHQRTGELQSVIQRLDASYGATLEALVNALDAREHGVHLHSQRVRRYTLILAKMLGIEEVLLENVGRGALLHDVGKIGVSDDILLKRGKLSPAGWAEMKRHPNIGYEILRNVSFLHSASEIVLAHHEWYDGSGYPCGLAGRKIVLGARIFAVADAFDAIVSDRPYRKALSYEYAREEIKKFSGTQFDPEVVEFFLNAPQEVWEMN